MADPGQEPQVTTSIPFYPIAGADASTDESSEPGAQDDSDLKERVPEDVYDYIKELRQENAERRTKTKEFEDLGDPEELRRAKQLWESTKTADGLKSVAKEAIEVLQANDVDISDLTPEQAEQLAEDIEDAEEETGAPVTKQDLESLKQEATQEALKSVEQFKAEQANKDFKDAILSSLDRLEIEDPQDRHDVLAYANAHMTDSVDSSNVHEVVKKGFEDWKQRLDQYGELAVQRYLESKKGDAEGTPEGLSGSSPVVGQDLPEPANVKEANERLRKRLEGGAP